MHDILARLLPFVALCFLASAMFSLGLDLTLRQIVDPLRSRRLLGASLVANILLVPLVAVGISQVVPMNGALATGLVVYALAAGTEGGPKFAQLAKGNAGLAVGLLALLVAATIVFMPVALSMAVPHAHIDRANLLVKLLASVALPMGSGLVIRAYRPDIADRIDVAMHRFSIALLGLFVSVVVYVNFDDLLSVPKSALLAAALFFATAFAMGYTMGGPRQENRRALAIMTFVRNAPISLTTATQVFPGEPGVLTMVTLMCSLSVVACVMTVAVLNRLPAPSPLVTDQLAKEKI